MTPTIIIAIFGGCGQSVEKNNYECEHPVNKFQTSKDSQEAYSSHVLEAEHAFSFQSMLFYSYQFAKVLKNIALKCKRNFH